ncbi:MAG: hypothetical protein BVN31_01690 [Proteobacteria bacterium ST_bin15]|nr:MAG: hypothetical protein BVN31_01690 [Proteobacteria bacterium ST_bin15]
MDARQMTSLAIACGIAGTLAYAIGLWRRWRPGSSGRPAFTESSTRVREPWTVAAVLLLLTAAALKFYARSAI